MIVSIHFSVNGSYFLVSLHVLEFFLWKTEHFEFYNKVTLEIIIFLVLRVCFGSFLWVLVICLVLFYLFL